MIWDTLTWPQLDAIDRRVPVILPLAATEQHGPHLPLATDRLIAEHFCQRLHDQMPDEVLILSTMAVGCSAHHMDFPGSLTLTHATFIQAVSETLEAVAAHGFKNLILFNAHGGNLASGRVALEMFGRRHPDCRAVMMTWWQLAAPALLALNETGPGGVGHAGEFETSLMLLIAPHQVAMEAIAPRGNQPTFDWAEADLLRSPQAALYRTFKEMTRSGAYGDPTQATREKGEAITALVLAEMVRIVRDLAAEIS